VTRRGAGVQKLAAGQACRIKEHAGERTDDTGRIQVFRNNPNTRTRPHSHRQDFSFINQRREYKLNEQSSFND
jgi:hypothetical protein